MQMKQLVSIGKAAAIALVLGMNTGCERDNRAQPKSELKGRVVYEGNPVGVRSNGVQLELWQPGYALFTKIEVYVAQDGTFSSSLFDGDYKLVKLRGNGPWVDNRDTINVQVRGVTELDVPVRPYFNIKNDRFTAEAGKVTATFDLSKLETAALERVNLYIGRTLIVDPNNNIGSVQLAASAITDLTKPVTLSVNIPAAYSGREYVYARVGVKTSGVGEMLFGTPQKVMLK